MSGGCGGKKVKNSKVREKLVNELGDTRNVLEDLANLASKAEHGNDRASRSRLSTLDRVMNAESSPLASCYKEIDFLNANLAPPIWAPEGSKRREAHQALAWALKDKEISKMLVKLENLRSELTVALNIDQG
ncbi:MAG: hypothetical protein Q9210_003421 [Variospora velana]